MIYHAQHTEVLPILETKELIEIDSLFEGRMIESAYLYKSSPSLIQMYDFCKKVIDKIQ